MSTPQLLGGRYEVGALIGRGGMAEVHLGHDNRLSRQVAIKMLRSDLARDPAFIVRFRREARSAAGLNHASIVAVYDSGDEHITQAGGAELAVPYIVMEFVEGRTLRQALNDTSPLEPIEAARITEQVLDALAYSHRMGIVHRDIKPANVMLTASGDVKVMDFGIARAIADTNATMTQTQAVIGTAQYLSPEQAQGQTVDARSDLYSTGCMLFELLTGRTPFTGDSPVSIAYQHVGEAPPRPSSYHGDIPPELDAVVLHALVKDREARYQTAAAFEADLQAVRTGEPISAEARGTGLLGAAGAAGAAAAGATAVAMSTAGATEYIPQSVPAEPTEVLTRAGTRARQESNTASLPAIGRDPDDEPSSGRGWAWALLSLLAVGIVVLGVLWFQNGFGGSNNNVAGQQVTVPSVIDKQQDIAETEVRAQGLVPKIVMVANEKDPGIVVDQSPDGGAMADEKSEVTLNVSSGPNSVEIPDLRDQTEDEARAALKDLDSSLVVSTKTVNESDITKGSVVSTSPRSGESVEEGGAVVLNLSSGKVTVPNVTGKDQASAVRTLTELGFKYDSEYRDSTEADEGTVLGQSVREELANYGSTITLTVARKPEPSPSPTSTPTDTPSQTTTTTTTPPPAGGG